MGNQRPKRGTRDFPSRACPHFFQSIWFRVGGWYQNPLLQQPPRWSRNFVREDTLYDMKIRTQGHPLKSILLILSACARGLVIIITVLSRLLSLALPW